jgi:hypothetical protein
MLCKILYSGVNNEIGQIFMSARIPVSGFFEYAIVLMV